LKPISKPEKAARTSAHPATPELLKIMLSVALLLLKIDPTFIPHKSKIV
jgi:hypothetical protein